MTNTPSRRLVLTRSAALVGAASSGLLLPEWAMAQSGKIRVGLMLPYSGAFAPLGVAIQDMYLRVAEKGENKVIGIAAKGLADPGTGCRMG